MKINRHLITAYLPDYFVFYIRYFKNTSTLSDENLVTSIGAFVDSRFAIIIDLIRRFNLILLAFFALNSTLVFMAGFSLEPCV